MSYLSSLGKYLRYFYILVAFLVAMGLVRNILKVSSAEKRLVEAEEKLSRAEVENKELNLEVGKITSETYVESQARDKLGLAKEGEIVLILPPEEEVKKFSIRQEDNEDYELPEENWKKWVKVFF